MISTLGLLDGLTAAIILIFSAIFGLLSFYHARKLEAKLLAVAGIMMFFVGFLWLGPFVDFLLVVLTGENLNPMYLYAWLSYCWVAPGIITAMYLGSELMWPEKKKVVVIIYTVIGVIFELFLFLDVANTFQEFVVKNPGDVIDAKFNRTSPTFILVAVFLVSVLIFLAIGFAIKAKQATGELRKKFAFLSIAFFIFVICAAFDSIIDPGVTIGVIRLIMATFSIWMYLGLKT